MTGNPTRSSRWRIANHQPSTEAQAAIIDWAQENNLDPSRILANSVEIDDDARVIHYEEVVPAGTPGARRPTGRYGTLTRPATAPLLTDPPPAAYGHPAPRLAPSAAEQAAAEVLRLADAWRGSGDTADGARRAEAALIAAVDAWRKTRPTSLADLPTGSVMPPDELHRFDELIRQQVEQQRAASAYDWTRYERTCAPDRQLDGLGDLALFLGGSEDSFTGRLLALIAKAQSTPANLAALERGFPREVTAWRVWRSMGDPTPTAVDLCAELILRQQITETRARRDRAFQQHHWGGGE